MLQVRAKEASKFLSAADAAARTTASNAADRAYVNQLLDPKNIHPRSHPMLRNIASDGFGLPPRGPTQPTDPETQRMMALVRGGWRWGRGGVRGLWYT